MLKNIKSPYFVQIIFSFFEEKLKLKLVKYSKFLKNIFDIYLINYKFFSGRYIIFEESGKGKEYKGENDELIYEGEYLNGKRNGKGKEYNKYGFVSFQGEYLNNIPWKGKVYDQYTADKIIFELDNTGKKSIIILEKGKVIYEGEYLNGKRNGKGKEFHENGRLKFSGTYLNWERNGKGIEYNYDGTIRYEGEFLYGKLWNCKINDKINDNISYEIKNGKGFIKEYYRNQLIFEGEYLNGQRNGKGKEYYRNQLIFEGEYLNGKRNGKGKEFYDTGGISFEGEYLYGYKRKGTFYAYKKMEYEGEFLFNKKWNGKGFDENGNVIYELNNGNGKVKEYNDIGSLIFEGEYLNGKKME